MEKKSMEINGKEINGWLKQQRNKAAGISDEANRRQRDSIGKLTEAGVARRGEQEFG